MSARNFKNRADWVSVVVEVAEAELKRDPYSRLMRSTQQNISGGHDYWGESTDQLYRSPETPEEGLLALELKRVLEIASHNQLRYVYQQAISGEISLSLLGFPMDYGTFMGVVKKLAVRNPLLAVRYKIEASRLSEQANGKKLTDFMTDHCLVPGIRGEDYCSDI